MPPLCPYRQGGGHFPCIQRGPFSQKLVGFSPHLRQVPPLPASRAGTREGGSIRGRRGKGRLRRRWSSPVANKPAGRAGACLGRASPAAVALRLAALRGLLGGFALAGAAKRSERTSAPASEHMVSCVAWAAGGGALAVTPAVTRPRVPRARLPSARWRWSWRGESTRTSTSTWAPSWGASRDASGRAGTSPSS